MPIALNHVNIYAIEDGPGWAVVDTGLADETQVGFVETII
jgi:glyoxylase-like metal-dependent hydrolase (beta-lactamase superfamily II)